MKNWIADVRTASTQYGTHYWLEWLKCQRKAWLSSHDTRGEIPRGDPRTVGSFVHALLALYYKSSAAERLEIDTRRVRYRIENQPRADGYDVDQFEAERCFRGYRVFDQGQPLGKTVSVEETYTSEALPKPLTGGIDLVVEMGKRDAKRAGAPSSGLWVVDHKTRAKSDPHEWERGLMDPQFASYWHLAEQKHGKCQGVIINAIFKSNGGSAARLFLPAVAMALSWNRTKYALRYAMETVDQVVSQQTAQPNLTQCYTHGYNWSMCKYAVEGICDQGSKS